MKINSISNYYTNENLNWRGKNTLYKQSVRALIASSSLFMLSNAVHTFNKENNATNKTEQFIDLAASFLGLFGTYAGIVGLKEDEKDNNRYR